MSDKNKMADWMEMFRKEFPDEASSMNILVEYEVLLLQIENLVENEPSESLGSKITDLINSFKNDR